VHGSCKRARGVCKPVAIPHDRPRIAGVVVAFAIASAPFAAEAQPLRLRGDAVVDTQSAEGQSPAGLLVLQGQDAFRPWLDAEGLMWAGARSSAGVTGDVMVLALRLRDPRGHGELRVGRFVVATGAIFPVQIDGAEAIGRTAWGGSVEAFGGAPVVPRFGARSYDWIVGGRLSQHVASKVTMGVSYVQRREYGDVSNEEVGADFAAAPARWLDLAAKGAYDLTTPGIADARLSAATRTGAFRFELFAAEQSPGRLLPATSLFSVLGDFPSQTIGGTAKWNAAPRLDVSAGGAAQSVGGQPGGNGWIRSTLRLDDRGAGSLGLEVRRVDVSSARWTGVRAVGAQPLGRGFRFSTELEIVVPDEPDGRGIAWPWGLMALAWRSPKGWEIAAAVEAASTPTHLYEANALARVARSLELP
jgi:hypothetical protein